MSDFVHLHCHTEYSLLDGAIRIQDMCKKAVASGMSAASITDHGNLHGAAEFWSACRDHGLRPLVGCEVYVAKDHLAKDDPLRYHLILLSMNNTGLKNLYSLCSIAHTEGFYSRPRVDKGLLARYGEGLIALSACYQGEVPRLLTQRNEYNTYLPRVERYVQARDMALQYKTIFGDRYYLEIQKNSLTGQDMINEMLAEISAEIGVPLVATNDCHYLDRDDSKVHDTLLCIQTRKLISEKDRLRFDTDSLYFKTGEEMSADFADYPGTVERSGEIAERCKVEMQFGKHCFPVCSPREGRTIEQEFDYLCHEGMRKKLKDISEDKRNEYMERLRHEMSVIHGMGFPGYFLIVQDFINWAKARGIPVGPGRGSAAGSLVAWVLGITGLDPLAHDLLFERFLNSERVSLPDIDVDFCERRRGEVINYMIDKYGKDHVAQIVTFGTLKARQALKDVGRAHGLDFDSMNRLTRAMPENMSIAEALEADPAFHEQSLDPVLAPVFKTALRLEGLCRHAGIHAAGLVVSDKPMTEYAPVFLDRKEGGLVSQFDMHWLERCGLVKFDFLGLKTLTVIQDTLDSIRESKLPVPDLNALEPFDDPAVWKLYASGSTTGLFQVEGEGLTKYLMQLRPTCFEDLVAMLALYRPGPLGSGMVDAFVRRKRGSESVTYFGLDSLLGPILAPTYGVIVYQEQVMQIARTLAGYSLGDADLLRRAMGKKVAKEMAAQRDIFIKGCHDMQNIGEALAEEIFGLMEKFAEYGFNKSHSAAYALISYQTAYLKAHYPVHFMAALLTGERNNPEKLTKYMAAANHAGIQVLPPSVNESRRIFAPSSNGKNVVYGLDALKGFGEKTAEAIIAERKKGGSFASLYDLAKRVGIRTFSKKNAKILFDSGCCDCFGETRRAMTACFENEIYHLVGKEQTGQLSLFPDRRKEGGMGVRSKHSGAGEYPLSVLLANEKVSFGSCLSGHPLDAWKGRALPMGVESLASLRLSLEAGASSKDLRLFAVRILDLKKRQSKKTGKPFVMGMADDLTDSFKLLFFSRQYDAARDAIESALISQRELFLLEARPLVDYDEDGGIAGISLVGESIEPLVLPESRPGLYMNLKADENLMPALKGLVESGDESSGIPFTLSGAGMALRFYLKKGRTASLPLEDLPLFERLRQTWPKM